MSSLEAMLVRLHVWLFLLSLRKTREWQVGEYFRLYNRGSFIINVPPGNQVQGPYSKFCARFSHWFYGPHALSMIREKWLLIIISEDTNWVGGEGNFQILGGCTVEYVPQNLLITAILLHVCTITERYIIRIVNSVKFWMNGLISRHWKSHLHVF